MRRSNKEEFVVKANIIHQNKYDYSKFVYTGVHAKGIIICLNHGEFYQRPSNHLSYQGCPICGGSFISNKEKFYK